MLINQDFTVDRSKFIGGSDIGAILGVSTYRSPLEVWMEKTGKDTRKRDSLPLRFGSFAEEFIAQEYYRATGFELRHDESTFLHPQHAFMSAHVDRFVLGKDANLPATRILECKTAHPFSASQWGEAGTDQVPMSYLCQCIWYMAITQIDRADLAVLFGNSDFRIYEITRDCALEALVLEKAQHFWYEYVQKDLPPPANSELDCQLLFNQGDPEKIIEASSEYLELINRFQNLNIQLKEKEAQVSQVKQSLMQFMGDAETLSYQGSILATWKAPKQSFKLDSKRLEANHPTLCQDYKVAIQNSRRLVVKNSAYAMEAT